MGPLLYLDANCFQRSFDDPRQVRIQLEAIACQEVFRLAHAGELRLIWSFMHQDEVSLCPFPERQAEVVELSKLCEVRVEPAEPIRQAAVQLHRDVGLKSKDALHLACAVQVRATYVLTCDDDFVRKATRANVPVPVKNPVDFIRERFDEPGNTPS